MALDLDRLSIDGGVSADERAPADSAPVRAAPATADLRRPPGILRTHGAAAAVAADPEDPLRWFSPDRLEPGLSCRSVAPTSDLGVRAEQFVYEVFRTSGFCAESPRRHVEETEPWRAGSTLHVVVDDGPDGGPGEILGVVRTVTGRFEELPVSRFEPEIPVPDGLLCEIGSLAVQADQRGLGVANELHRAAFLAGIERRACGFCFLIEQWMFDFFGRHYGLPVRRLAPPSHFMGGEIVPTGMWMPEMLHVIAERRPNVYAWAVEDLDGNLHSELDLPTVTV